MFPEDEDMERNRDWIPANSCYKFDGIWNFPKQPDKKIIEVKYIFYAPVLPPSVSKSGFKLSEDDEALQIYQEIKLNNRSNFKLLRMGLYICSVKVTFI